jgi:hypothetical protein
MGRLSHDDRSADCADDAEADPQIAQMTQIANAEADPQIAQMTQKPIRR